MTVERLLATLRRQGITDERVLAAMAEVPRVEFVPEEHRAWAWDDTPLPIGEGQTISQPFIVAYTAQTLALPTGSTVLDVGTGCGYQAAVLARLGYRVHSVEIREELAGTARERLQRLGYEVEVHVADGRRGLPAAAPFDGIAVAAASRDIPQALVEQLREPGGRMVIPVGRVEQRLVLVERRGERAHLTDLLAVRFVPLL
jgi:protein-L-isoaspartate(D-aspartate) O-methyltransferase